MARLPGPDAHGAGSKCLNRDGDLHIGGTDGGGGQHAVTRGPRVTWCLVSQIGVTE